MGKQSAKDDLVKTRLRTLSNRKKAFDTYADLYRSGHIEQAVVVARMRGGEIHVIGQQTRLSEIGGLLYAAATALEQAETQEREIKPEAHEQPDAVGEHSGMAARTREVKRTADGTLQPPPGEGFLSCGECNHPRWYITHLDTPGSPPGRFVCSHCMDEVKVFSIDHAAGRA
jgi:hypothetical protein